jgi:Tfp pilus assembly protein PilZ
VTETINIKNDLSTGKESETTPSTSTPSEPSDKNEVTVRLIKILLAMPEKDQQHMLKTLENERAKKQDVPANKKPSSEDLRKHPRKTSLIAVDCATHDNCFTNFIHDISNGGVFIETNAPFYVNQKITLTFSLPGADGPILIGGEVIRVDSKGIGVAFVEGDVHKIDIQS